MNPLMVAEGWVLGCRVWAKAFFFFFFQVHFGDFLSEMAQSQEDAAEALQLLGNI